MKNGFHFHSTARNMSYALLVFLATLVLVIFAAVYARHTQEDSLNLEFLSVCSDIQTKIDLRIRAQAQLLRSGAAFFAASDSVTRKDWEAFYRNSNIDVNLPGILGLGYAKIIPRNQLADHIRHVRSEGFPDYTVRPETNREVYTSIMYLEPFSGRNLRAFGYDMFSEPVRRRAMEMSRDSNRAILSGKVYLVQETNTDVQAGVLMYVPVYRHNKPISTAEERRAAIYGWVYSPYRMNDLIEGVLGPQNLMQDGRIRLEIYDGMQTSEESLLFDSRYRGPVHQRYNRTQTVSILFHGNMWTLKFSQSDKPIPVLQHLVTLIFIGGLIIAVLFFFLVLNLLNTRLRAVRMAEDLTVELQQAKQQAESANQAKSEFLLNVSHEFKTPLNAVMNYAELIATAGESERNAYAESIRASGGRLLSMVNDILDLIKSENNGIELVTGFVETEKFIRQIAKGFEDKAREKDLRFVTETAENLPHSICVDEKRLRQVISNLVDNAIKYTDTGEVSLHVAALYNTLPEPDDKVTLLIEVNDTGKGISEAYLKRLFEEFSQEEKKTVLSGIGIGLALTRRLTDKMHGTIGVVSKQGVGSTFTVSIPGLVYRKDETPFREIREKKTVSVPKIRREQISEPDALLSSLEGSFLETCRRFEKIQPIHEVREFGQNLVELGTRHQAGFVTEYGKTLIYMAENLDIDGMLVQIRKYKTLVDTLTAQLPE
jgi:signal transduction histidine kinase